MKIKAGETRYLVRKIKTEKSYDNVRFRLTNKKNTIEKSTDAEAVKDKVIVQDGVFLIPLQQKDTADLVGSVTIEAEIDYQDKSVRYTDYNAVYVNESLGWEQITGSKPSDDDGIEPVMEAIEEGIYIIVGPESSQELIDAVTQLFQDTKQIAQSVRDDADAGMFNGEDGQDGYSPQVTVKTETPSTYILHIKDADHEFDTPNLQGQGGEGSIEVGDGLKREGNVVSVDLQDSTDNALDFSYDKKIRFSKYDNGHDSNFRTFLADSNYNNPLASKSYVDNLMSGATKWEFVSQLPTEDIDIHTIYFVPKADAETDNIYDEWVYAIKSRNPDVYDWELLGTNEVDLSNYQTLITSTNKVNADYIDDSTSTNKFTNATEKQTWNGKQDLINSNNKLNTAYCNDTNATRNKFYTPTEKNRLNGLISQKANKNIYNASYTVDAGESITGELNVAEYDTLKIKAIDSGNPTIFYKLDNGTTQTFTKADFPLDIDVSNANTFKAWVSIGPFTITYDLTSTDIVDEVQPKIDSSHKLNADLLADGTTNKPSEWNNKVNKLQTENNNLSLADGVESSEISVSDYSFLTFDTSHLENDDVLTMYYKIGNTWDSKTISHDSWYEYVFEYDAIKFKVVTTPSSETREFKYSLYNDVIRQRQYSREIGALQNGKQDTIDSSHKLSADNVDDTNSTNKFVPTSTSADNGKFLRVVNGVATWVTVPQAESQSY